MDNSTVINDLLKNQKKSENVDEIVCIVDRSGSMGSIKADAQGGLNEFINQQKTLGEANLTIVEFDSEIKEVCHRKPINEFKEYVLVPRSMTALLDAIGFTIGKMRDVKPDGKMVFVIVTDGGENASQEYTHESITALITELKGEAHGWEFLFLAANQDAIAAGASIGISADRSMNFTASAKGVGDAYDSAMLYSSAVRGVVPMETFDSHVADVNGKL
jgi:hypothetical protein